MPPRLRTAGAAAAESPGSDAATLAGIEGGPRGSVRHSATEPIRAESLPIREKKYVDSQTLLGGHWPRLRRLMRADIAWGCWEWPFLSSLCVAVGRG